MGLFAAVFFVLICLSALAVGQEDENEFDNKPLWKSDDVAAIQPGSVETLTIELANNLISSYGLSIVYGKAAKTQEHIPLNAMAHSNGFVSGIDWKPDAMILNSTNHRKRFKYQLFANLRWSLLGIGFYHQTKTYVGYVDLT